MSVLPENREVLMNFLTGTIFEEEDLDNEQTYFNRYVGWII